MEAHEVLQNRQYLGSQSGPFRYIRDEEKVTDKVANIPVVANDKGAESRIVGSASINYQTGDISMKIDKDTVDVLKGSFGPHLQNIGLFFGGLNASGEENDDRHAEWTKMIETKEVFERETQENN